jgi:hypothetical protein
MAAQPGIVERSLHNVRAALTEATAGAPPEKRLAVELDVMFDRRLAVPEINQIVDELIAASSFDEFTAPRSAGSASTGPTTASCGRPPTPWSPRSNRPGVP